MISNLVTFSRILLLAPLFALLGGPEPIQRWFALGVFLLAGFTDVIDGRLARALDEVSPFGAMLDLIADRLLTLVVLIGLIASGELRGPVLIAGLILVARDLIVASFGESVSGLNIRVSVVEKVKITFQFLAFGLLIAPPVWPPSGPADQHDLGGYALEISALLTCVTLVSYARRTVTRLKAT